jgi:hypothetical protein
VSPQFDVFAVTVSDMARSLVFYRPLGLEFPEGAETEPHVEAPLPGGMHYALDTEEVMRSFDPEWKRPTDGHSARCRQAPSTATRRSMSSPFVHQPHDARSQPVPGMSRTITPAS